MRVLVIDDDIAFRHLMAGMLAFACPGADVEQYDPVEKGCPAAEFGLAAFDLVFLDYRLGREDGLEWLRTFKSRPGCPPTVIITGQGNETVAVRAMKLGAADYLAKQRISGDVLARVVQEAMEARKEQAGSTVHLETPPVEEPRRDTELRIEGYRVIREIGEGAASHVYLVVPEAGGEPIIAKVLLEELIQDQDSLARFLQEYQIVGRIKSRHVAKYFKYGFSDSSAYILMEYLPGGDVRDYFTSRPLDQGRILAIFRQVLMALGDIHAAGIVHRDLKPHNIMFRSDGSVALVDFGIAKILGEPGMTQHGTLLGSPTYMSPEAITGGVVNARSDLYSAGIMLYQMLAKKAPFQGNSAQEILQQHVSARVPPLPRSQDDFQELVDVLLAKDPEARPQSAEATLKFIDRLFYE
jgi:ActR/RegA family two-component response regulator/tRNA A-37 threonylcarbamoyl transferase component Bud32